ncbi:MAG: DUF2851 family protein [Cyclobacteriaceae bacterium]
MREEILHYLWQHQAFDHTNLQTVRGEQIQIYSAGTLNTHSGPDFALARIHIDPLEWCGSVEIHIKSSDWNHHHHQGDPAYDRVVLHVVWQYDREIYRADGTVVPTLELKNRVDPSMLLKIEGLLNSCQPSIACAPQVKQVPSLIKTSQLERAAAQRLERKAQEILLLAEANQGDWEETAYQWLLKCFGFQVNGDAMLQLARALPLRWIKKYQTDNKKLLQLFLHQAGLSDKVDQAGNFFVAIPEDLKAGQLNTSAWRYSRMRPANFPDVRITQVAQLLCQWGGAVNWLFQPGALSEIMENFRITDHDLSKKAIGKKSIENLMINGLAPLLTAYGLFHRDDTYKEHAWSLLEALPSEDNRVVRTFVELTFPNESALDTQGMIEQYQRFCQEKKCLTCSIGSAVMKTHHLFVS